MVASADEDHIAGGVLCLALSLQLGSHAQRCSSREDRATINGCSAAQGLCEGEGCTVGQQSYEQALMLYATMEPCLLHPEEFPVHD